MEVNFQYCAELARGWDPDLYFCALLGPRARRRSLVALLAFNAELDRIAPSVSEAMLGEIRLEWWREAIGGMRDGTPRRHPVVDELASQFTGSSAFLDQLIAMIDARSVELAPDPFADEPALLQYADRVGGALHRAILVQTADPEPPAVRAASAVGSGWALVRILANLPRGEMRAQNLVPITMRRDAGLRQGRFFDADAAPGREMIGRAIAGLANAQFAAARANISRMPRGLVPGLVPLVMGEAQLARFARANHDPARSDPDQGVVGRQLRAMLAVCRRRL